MTDNSPLTAYTREISDGTASTSPLDHPAKRTCLTRSNEHCTQMHKPVTPNSLASCIGEKTVWEDDNDMVSLSSPTQELLESNGDEYSEDNLNGMSIDNTFFTQRDIRYAALPDEREPTTNSLLALIRWTSTLSCSSAVCSLLDVLPKACFNQCTHGLAYSACYGNSGFYRVIHGRPDIARLSLGL